MQLDAAQRQAAFGSQDPRQTGRILMWTGDSAEIAAWHQQSAYMVTECLIPRSPLLTPAGQTSQSKTELLLSQRMPVQVRSLMISKQCTEPELAAELAAFLALDVDSLLMQSRFQIYEGLVPLIQDDLVWKTLVGRQKAGQRLQILQNKLSQAYCSGRQITGRWNQVIQASIGLYGQQLLLAQDQTKFAALLDQLSQAVRTAQEG